MLSPTQEKALELIESGQNLFITGGAGTGKSFLLSYLKDRYKSELHVTASTGIAAVNVGGGTLHSWACLGLGDRPVSDIVKFITSKRGKKHLTRLQSVEKLAIDEVSMIRSDLFDKLDQVLQRVRDSNLPFGGVQLLLFGDFLQLPPVVKPQEGLFDMPFCFQADAWFSAEVKTHLLEQTHRQKDDHFIGLLDRLRYGNPTQEDWETLTGYQHREVYSAIQPTILTTHNYKADQINQAHLAELEGEEKVFHWQETGDEKHIQFLKKNCLASPQLVLKEGAQVMMLKNTFAEEGIVNGSIGIVEEFTEFDIPVVRFNNGVLKEIRTEEWAVEEFNEDEGKVIKAATVLQFPLRLAWAITVHKSQGMTLDAIECDLEDCFVGGQIYVALSRLKSIDGLYLKTFPRRIHPPDQRIVEFYRGLGGTPPLGE